MSINIIRQKDSFPRYTQHNGKLFGLPWLRLRLSLDHRRRNGWDSKGFRDLCRVRLWTLISMKLLRILQRSAYWFTYHSAGVGSGIAAAYGANVRGTFRL